MTLSEYVGSNRERIILRWKHWVRRRLSIKLEESEVVNALPLFLDDMVRALNPEDEGWPAVANAESHGCHRLRSGTDIGSLIEEMHLVFEVVVELAREDERVLSSDDVVALSRAIARGTAASASAYTRVRDQELQMQAQRHFSFVAHELRTPLQTAQLAAQVLDRGLSGAHAKLVGRLRRALAHVTERIDNSLVEVRLSGTPEVQLARVEARGVIETVCDQLQEHFEDKKLRLSIEAGDLVLDADEKLLTSALTNLVGNAIKFTAPASCIHVRARERADRVIFEVEDECGGLSEDAPARLFQPFVQTSDDKSGHGLGLMIVKQAVEAHGGTVHVNNRPPKGCVFVLKLPLRAASSD